MVAHRLSTIYDADRILVMDNGNIAETGNHKELMSTYMTSGRVNRLALFAMEAMADFRHHPV